MYAPLGIQCDIQDILLTHNYIVGNYIYQHFSSTYIFATSGISTLALIDIEIRWGLLKPNFRATVFFLLGSEHSVKRPCPWGFRIWSSIVHPSRNEEVINKRVNLNRKYILSRVQPYRTSSQIWSSLAQSILHREDSVYDTD